MSGDNRSPHFRHMIGHGNGGKSKTTSGYIVVYKPDHPYATKNGCVLEHRLVMEQKLGRYLSPDEVVHHINGIRSDNRIENLELLSGVEHGLYNRLCGNCKLRGDVSELEKQVKLLKWQVQELNKKLYEKSGVPDWF